ncbi:MAG: DUF4350 domain-containing protein [Pseudomonadota bacterium]
MRSKLLFAALAVLVFAGASAWFLHNFERVDVDERGPPNTVVDANSFYGIGRFLERYEIASQPLSTLNPQYQLPDSGDTLVLGFAALYLSELNTRRLASWVSSGGHLMLPFPYDTDGTVLEYFNIVSEDVEDNDPVDNGEENDESLDDETPESDTPAFDFENFEEVDTETDTPFDPEAARYLYTARINDQSIGEFAADFPIDDDLYSNRDTIWTMDIERERSEGGVDQRTYALGFRYGLGSVSLVSDLSTFRNANFYRGDNALLSLALLTQTRDPGKVWFVQTIMSTSFWERVWSNGAHLIMWFALGTILFFWWAGQRLGRVLPNPSLKRREFNEHLSASGRFLWQQNHRTELLRAAQSALRDRALARFPRLHALNKTQADQQLKTLLDRDYDLWVFAMRDTEQFSKPQFLEQIKAIQSLWKRL